MLPPIDPTILATNPQFRTLHQDLTSNYLHEDGSTRAKDTEGERRAVTEVLLLPPPYAVQPLIGM